MELNVTLTSIPASSVAYKKQTGLFPFSPRREIDSVLVARLKRSMSETGVWQPIVVRAETMEGIAGNHRFLAQLELAEEAGLRHEDVEIMAVLVDCDEGLAVTIALAENEMRQNLTEWEAVRALLMAANEKPEVAAGSAVLQVAHGGEGFPVEALIDDGKAVQGENVLPLDDVEAYCVAPDIRRDGSCFRNLEVEAMAVDLDKMKQLGLPAVLPSFLRDVEARNDFVWRSPQREGTPCTPESCPYVGDDGRGLIVVLQPGERSEGVCLNAECGGEAREALVDWEVEERYREVQRRRGARPLLRAE